jgi:hypothetical protein
VFLPAGMRPFDERDRVGSIRVGGQDGMIDMGKVAPKRLARGSALVPRLDTGAQVDVLESRPAVPARPLRQPR